eukprot:338600_1
MPLGFSVLGNRSKLAELHEIPMKDTIEKLRSSLPVEFLIIIDDYFTKGKYSTINELFLNTDSQELRNRWMNVEDMTSTEKAWFDCNFDRCEASEQVVVKKRNQNVLPLLNHKEVCERQTTGILSRERVRILHYLCQTIYPMLSHISTATLDNSPYLFGVDLELLKGLKECGQLFAGKILNVFLNQDYNSYSMYFWFNDICKTFYNHYYDVMSENETFMNGNTTKIRSLFTVEEDGSILTKEQFINRCEMENVLIETLWLEPQYFL